MVVVVAAAANMTTTTRATQNNIYIGGVRSRLSRGPLSLLLLPGLPQSYSAMPIYVAVLYIGGTPAFTSPRGVAKKRVVVDFI